MKEIASPVDYVFTGTGSQPITFAFYFRKKLDPLLLQSKLDEILQHFPLLSSQIVKCSDNDYEYHPCRDGLSFKILQTNNPFKEIRKIDHYITPVNTMPGNPLIKIVLTQTSDGSVLAASISHALVDGFSYFHFFSSWARLCRGERFIQPSLERRGMFPVVDIGAAEITADMVYQNCGLFYRDKRPALQNNAGREERIVFDKATIQSQMQEVKKDNPHMMFSDNDIIAALMWKKYLPMWSQNDDNPDTFLTCPVDFRRIMKTVPKTYFGCAVCFATACLDFNHLQQASIAELAVLVNRAVHSVNDLSVNRFLQTLENLRHQKGLDVCEQIHLRHPSHGMIITNLTRMPIRDLDFGGGIPDDYLIYSEVLRSAAILPAQDAYEIVVCHPMS